MLPTKINLLGYEFEVVSEPEAFIDGTTACLGNIDYVERRIRLSTEEPQIHQLDVLWHEVIHGVMDAALNNDPLTEDQMTLIGRGINSVLLNSPELLHIYNVLRPQEIWISGEAPKIELTGKEPYIPSQEKFIPKDRNIRGELDV